MFEITKTIHNECSFYGLKCDEKNIRIDDISSDIDAIEVLCSELEMGSVSIVNIMDIIEDFME